MLPPDWLGRIIAEKSCQVVVHLTCKDLNRNGLESAAWRYAAEGFENILVMTGDLPTAGFGGTARGVFDLDSCALVNMLGVDEQGAAGAGPQGRHRDAAEDQLLHRLRRSRRSSGTSAS